MKGNAIYFTAEEIKAIYEFDCNFDNYFSAVRDKELYEWLLSQGIWLILDKFSHCASTSNAVTAGKNIYFSYREIEFMSRFICEIDKFFPDVCDQERKEQLLTVAGKALLKFVLCFNRHYGEDNRYPLKRFCRYEKVINGCDLF